ncbi:MAG: protein kinase [Parachlamydiaceae bacterium]|nr:protein kinase [Parachlamydiaceae bacterium]
MAENEKISGDELTQMATNVNNFMKEVMSKASQISTTEGLRSGDLKQKINEDGNLVRRKWTHSGLELNAFVSPAGKIYLSSLSQILGSGADKVVFTGIDASRTGNVDGTSEGQVVFGVPREFEGQDQAEVNRKYEAQQAEVDFLKQVQGPGVVKFDYCFEMNRDDNGNVIPNKSKALGIILEYCNGGDLDHNLQSLNGGDLENLESFQKENLEKNTLAQVLIMKQIALGMSRIHTEGIVHADIKPLNILLKKDANGKIIDAVIADFGLSKKEGFVRKGLLGTCFSPDQLIRGEDSTIMDDVWDLGILFYEMIKQEDEHNVAVLYNEVIEKHRKDSEKFNHYLNHKDQLPAHHITKLNLEYEKFKKDLEFDIEMIKFKSNPRRNEKMNKSGYELIQTMMEKLSWDTLFFKDKDGNKMTSNDVLIRVTSIEEELDKILKTQDADPAQV